MRTKAVKSANAARGLFAGDGEIAGVMGTINWANTPVGPVSAWSPALRTIVGLLLHSRFPLALWWGPDFVQIYNDAYSSLTGVKHPGPMGQPADECRSEIWRLAGPIIQAAFSGKPATFSQDLSLLIDRNAFQQETHFKVAYTPVPDESAKPCGIGGVLGTFTLTTEQVHEERRLRTLHELATSTAGAKTPEQACEAAAAAFLKNPWDVPFALFYLLDEDGREARLAASSGFGGQTHANPATVDLRRPASPESAWPLGRILEARQVEVLANLPSTFGRLPTGCWSESPHTALALPLSSSDQAQPCGVMIAGLSPHRELTDGYRGFLELAVGQVTTAIRGALADQEARRRAKSFEVDLFEANQRLRRTLQAGEIGSFEVDLSTGQGAWNEVECRLLGIKPGEMTPNSETFFGFVHPEDRDGLRSQWEQAIKTGQLDAEFRIIRADGQERWLASKGGFFPHPAAGNHPTGQTAPGRFLGVNFDITERKRAEDFVKAVNSIDRLIHSTLDVNEVMRQAVSGAAIALGCDTAALSLRKDQTWVVSCVHSFPEDVVGSEINDAEEPHAVLAVRSKRPVVIDDAFTDGRVNREHMKEWGVRSVLVAPLLTQDEVIGVLFFNFHKRAMAFDDLHLDFASQLASSLSLALQNSKLFEHAQSELIARKRTEEILRRQTEELAAARAHAENERSYLEALMTALPVGVAMFDLQGGSIRNNEAYDALWGGSLPVTKGLADYPRYKAWWPETGRPVQPQEWGSARASLHGEKVEGQVIEIEGFDGVRRLVFNSAAPIRDASGNVIGSAVAVQDISDLRRAEEALAASNKRLQRVLATITEGYYALDDRWRFVEMNGPAEQHFGHPASELAGQNIWDVTRSRVDSPIRRRFHEAMANDAPVHFEAASEIRPGTSCELHVCPRPGGLDVFFHDISARKAAEEALRESQRRLASIVDSIADGFYALDRQWRFTHINDAALRYFNKTRLEMIGQRIQEVFPKIVGSVFEEAYRQAFEHGSSVSIETASVVTDSIVEIHAYPGPDNLTVLFRDVTERKRTEEALQRSPEELRQANAQLEQKVAERTAQLAQRALQLRALAGELTLSEQRERRRMAKILHDHLQQLLVGAKFRVTILGRVGDEVLRQATNEIEHLLDESIATSRSLTAELSPPILHDGGLKAGMEWLARWMADKHGLFVELSVEDRIPVLQEDVKVLLFESVRELLFNVVKHSQCKSATVNIRRVKGGKIQAVVADQGVGFDQAKLKMTGMSGTGFGLFTIQERVELIGGHMQIDSTPGTGSRFVLTTPLNAASSPAPAPVVVEAAPATPSAVEVASPAPGPKIRILLADDHAVVRQGLARLLSAEPDIQIVGEAADGRLAVQLAGKLRPDIVLMDVSMPGLDGLEATRMIRQEWPEVKVLGLSMFDEKERAEAMRAVGASAYLTKSGPAEELVAAIRSCSVRKAELPAESNPPGGVPLPDPRREG
ncbi:MAG: PAS domain S-box protein [Acidobacteria bacterium]|nr:MAG: PAS domain S-box protein [Acidobacteriota bacterium]